MKNVVKQIDSPCIKDIAEKKNSYLKASIGSIRAKVPHGKKAPAK